MSAAMHTSPRPNPAVAWIGIVGGVFVIAVAVALFVLVDLVHPLPGGWRFGFFALLADLILLGSAIAANGTFMRRTGNASRLLQGLTIPLAVGVAVIALTSLP